MAESLIWEKYQQLPANSREAVAKFIEFLFLESRKSQNSTSNKARRKGFGSWKGIRLSADFDAPLEDFHDYM